MVDVYDEMLRACEKTEKVRVVITNHKDDRVPGGFIRMAIFQGLVEHAKSLKDFIPNPENVDALWMDLVTYCFTDGSIFINNKQSAPSEGIKLLERFSIGMLPDSTLRRQFIRMADSIFTEFSIKAMNMEGLMLTTKEEGNKFFTIVSAYTDVIENGIAKEVPLVKFMTVEDNEPVEKAPDKPFFCMDYDAKFPFGRAVVVCGSPEGGIYKNFDDALAFVSNFVAARTASKSWKVINNKENE